MVIALIILAQACALNLYTYNSICCSTQMYSNGLYYEWASCAAGAISARHSTRALSTSKNCRRVRLLQTLPCCTLLY